MQDLAQAAGMSRAALYLLFKNKAELFRAGSVEAHRTALAEVDRALGGPGPVFERLSAALTGYAEHLLTDFATSPHREELFQAGKTLTGEQVRSVTAAMLERLEGTLLTAERAGEIDLSAAPSADRLAFLALATVTGAKHVNAPHDLGSAISSFAALAWAATAPR